MQRNWHHGYLQPALLALLIHLLFFALLLKPRPTLPPPAVEPVFSYLYTPPKAAPLPVVAPVVPVAPVLTEPLLPELPQTKTPAEPQADLLKPDTIAEPMAEIATAPPELPTATDAVTNTDTVIHTGIASSKVHATTQPASSSIAERTFSSVAQQYSAPAADYASWAKQQSQPRATVAKQHQLAGQDPAKAVLFTYNDGQQLVKLGDRCLIVDPALSGFEQLIKAKGAPCKESDDAILFRETMNKWLKR